MDNDSRANSNHGELHRPGRRSRDSASSSPARGRSLGAAVSAHSGGLPSTRGRQAKTSQLGAAGEATTGTNAADTGTNNSSSAPHSQFKKLSTKAPRKDQATSRDNRDADREPRNSRESKDHGDQKSPPTARQTARRASSQTTTELSSGIDPVSQQIFARTNTERSLANRLRTPARPESPANDSLPRPSSDLSVKQVTGQPDQHRDKKKATSFLSRLSMIGGGPKKRDDDIADDDSEIGSERRIEGADAIAFTSAINASGYVPRHKEPPRFVRMRAQNKKNREFHRLFLAQQLQATKSNPTGDKQQGGSPIWAMEFSKDGRYLATGGRDKVIRIWAILATPGDRRAYEANESQSDTQGHNQRLSAPVFSSEPLQEFTGHTSDILDLSWSRNHFLLSSSYDKTVRLWHLSRPESLRTFPHDDLVPSIAFHPQDDRFFLAGSLDATLRLWSIPDNSIAFKVQLESFVTAVAFSPDGRTSIAGCHNGVCVFYDTSGLKLQTQVHVRSSRGKNAKGSKITGIATKEYMDRRTGGIAVRVLITSADSRIRVYDLKNKTFASKIKGHENTCNQLRATFSEDGQYIICASEDRQVFIWSAITDEVDKDDKRPCEYFEAHTGVVTEAIFAPKETRILLQASDDPVYTLCNPPPVTLLSREEEERSTVLDDSQSEAPSIRRKPEESPAFIARSSHDDGNIIITTDQTGGIKVFRQDCAFAKRRQAQDNWETASAFSKKLGKDNILGRTGSIMTRTSGGGHNSRRSSIVQSRRGSLVQGFPPNQQMSPDQINSWRQGIEGGNSHMLPRSRPVSIAVSTPTPSERSVSPSKAMRLPLATGSCTNLASTARRELYANATPTTPLSPVSSFAVPIRGRDPTSAPAAPAATKNDNPTVPPTPGFSLLTAEEDEDQDNVLNLDAAGASYSFWNLNRWRNMGGLRGGNTAATASTGNLPPPPRSTAVSAEAVSADNVPQRREVGAASLPNLLTVGNIMTRRGSSDDRSPTSVSPERENRDSADLPPRKSSDSRGSPTRRFLGKLPSFSIPTTTVTRPSEDHGSGGGHSPVVDHPGGGGASGSGGGSKLSVFRGSLDLRNNSIVSRLSAEMTSNDGGDSEGDEMQCSKCGSRDFKAKKVGGKQRFMCGKCGRMVDGP